MKCNLPPKKKLPKAWNRLPDYERNTILEIMTETANENAQKQACDIQEIWIKLACMILHDSFEFTEADLHLFIAQWARAYARNRRIDTKEEQTEWLSKEMDKCFPSGFPQFRIDRMKGEYK